MLSREALNRTINKSKLAIFNLKSFATTLYNEEKISYIS